jgi:hypothetical protein
MHQHVHEPMTHSHMHYLDIQPCFMHIGGMGAEAKLAAAVGKVFSQETGCAKSVTKGSGPPWMKCRPD